MLARRVILTFSGLPIVEKLVRKTPIFRPLVSRFIAGDSIDEAVASSIKLVQSGLRVSLDYLGENTRSEAEALTAKKTYITMLEKVDAALKSAGIDIPEVPNGDEPMNISIKLTQCGLDQGEQFAVNNYYEVLATAQKYNNFVRIDMEASEYTERTLKIVGQALKIYPNTGTVLQSYLYRNDEDIETVIGWKARTRLVKGAYLEPESVAFPEKSKVDEAYLRQAKRLLEAGNYPAIATQDEKMITALNAFVKDKGIDKQSFEYQFLYGIRRDLQNSLIKDGYRVRIYVPFGDSWYPYFTRRLAERPANLWFIFKSLFKG